MPNSLLMLSKAARGATSSAQCDMAGTSVAIILVTFIGEGVWSALGIWIEYIDPGWYRIGTRLSWSEEAKTSIRFRGDERCPGNAFASYPTQTAVSRGHTQRT